jgi:hypothetical protein
MTSEQKASIREKALAVWREMGIKHNTLKQGNLFEREMSTTLCSAEQTQRLIKQLKRLEAEHGSKDLESPVFTLSQIRINVVNGTKAKEVLDQIEQNQDVLWFQSIGIMCDDICNSVHQITQIIRQITRLVEHQKDKNVYNGTVQLFGLDLVHWLDLEDDVDVGDIQEITDPHVNSLLEALCKLDQMMSNEKTTESWLIEDGCFSSFLPDDWLWQIQQRHNTKNPKCPQLSIATEAASEEAAQTTTKN